MKVAATAKMVRISPRKMGLVASLIRNRNAQDAAVILDHTPRRGAILLNKVLGSALANAEHNHQMQAKDLFVQEVRISPGTIVKRGRPVSRGRYHALYKRTTHMTVILTDQDDDIKPVIDTESKATTVSKTKAATEKASKKKAAKKSATEKKPTAKKKTTKAETKESS